MATDHQANMQEPVMRREGGIIYPASSELKEVTVEAGDETREDGEQTQKEIGTEEKKVIEDLEDKSTEDEITDIRSYGKDGTMTDGNTDFGSSKQVFNIHEAASDENREELIHIPDLTAISLNKRVEPVMEPCMKAESAAEAKFAGEEMREKSSTEDEKSCNLTDEVREETKLTEIVADDDDGKEKSMYGCAEDILASTAEIQRNEEATLKIREGDNEMLEKPSVYAAGPEESEKLNEASSVSCEEKSHDAVEQSKDAMINENSVDSTAMEAEGKDIISKSPDEDTSSINEVLPVKEASSGGNRYEEEESTITVAKEDITKGEIIDVFEHNQSDTTNHEDKEEGLQQEKPEKERHGEFNETVETDHAEAITTAKQETPIKSFDESLEKELERDLLHHTDANVIELNAKTECEEAEAQNKDANDSHDIQALNDEARETEGENSGEVIKTEPKRTIEDAYEVHTEEEEKHIEDAPEACQSSNTSIVEQTSLERAESTELIPTASETDEKKLQEASGLGFVEASVIMDNWENTDKEMQENGETCVDAKTSDEVDNAVFLKDENAEQNIPIKNPLDVAPEFTYQEESCIAGENDQKKNITNEEVHDRIAAIDEVIECNATHISPESIEKPEVESSEGNRNVAENSSGENNEEHVIEDSGIRCLAPKSVEKSLVKNFEHESTGEISDKPDTVEATESIGQETSKNYESPEEIVDDSKVKGDTLLIEENNLTPTVTSLEEEKKNEETAPSMDSEESKNDSETADVEDDNGKKTSKADEDLEQITQENEPGEEHPQSLSKISDKKEAFNSDAYKILGDVEEGPTQNLEEALQTEENEKAEVKNDTEYSKTAMKELYADSNNDGNDEETEKHEVKEECSTTENLPDTIAGESLESFKEHEKEEETTRTQESVLLETTGASEDAEKRTVEMEKNVDQSKEVEQKKTQRSIREEEKVSEIPEQGGDTRISPVSIEQETLENTEGNINKTEKSEGEYDKSHGIEENSSRDLILESESVEQRPVENSEDHKMEADKSTGKHVFDNSETLGTAENTVHATSTTIESATESLDSSLVKQGDSMQNEENQLSVTETSAENERNEERGLPLMANSDENELPAAKDNIENKPPTGQEDSEHIPQETALQEKDEQSLSMRSNANETFILNADKSPCLVEEGTQDLNQALWKEDSKKEVQEKNDAEENQIAADENLKRVAETSDENKSTESIVLEQKSNKDQILVQDETEKAESEELYEDSNDGFKDEDECSTVDILPEPTEKEFIRSSKEDEKTAETPEIQLYEDSNDGFKDEDECSTVYNLPEPIGKEIIRSSKEDEKTAETPEIQENVELKTTSESNNAGKQTLEQEKNADQIREVEEDEVEQSSQEDDMVSEIPKQGNDTYIATVSIEQETFESSDGNKDQEEKTEGENNSEQNVEESNTRCPIPESVDQSLLKNLEDDKMSEEKSTREVAEDRGLTNDDNEKKSSTVEEYMHQIQLENEPEENDRETEEKNGTKDNKIAEVDESNSFIEETEAASSSEEIVESVGSASGEKDMADTEIKETTLDSVDTNVTSEDMCKLGEKSDNEILTVDEKTHETNGGLIKEFAVVSHISKEETEEEIKETEEGAGEDSDSVFVTEVTEAKGLQEVEAEEQKQEENLFPAFKENSITETETKEMTLESVGMTVKQEHRTDLGEKRDQEMPEVVEEDREIVDCKIQTDAPHTGNVDQTEQTPNGKPNKIYKDETEEHSAMKSKENKLTSEVVEVEGAAIEQRGGAPPEEHEVAEYQNSNKLPEAGISQIDEIISGSQNQEDEDEDEDEIKAKEQTQLEAEERKEKNENETIKAVISTAKEDVVQSDDSEDIKEMVMGEEAVNKLNDALATVGEKTEMQDSPSVCSEYNKAADLKENTKIETPETGEDSAREGEPSIAKESEEQKVQQITIEPSETDTSLGEVQIDEKLVSVLHIGSDKSNQEATETEKSQEGKEFGSAQLEETSELACKLSMNDSGSADRECVTVENKNRDAGAPEEAKIASDASKSQITEEAAFEDSQAVKNPDQVPTDNYDHAAVENPGRDGVEETEIVSNEVEEVSDAIYGTKDWSTEKAEVQERQTVGKPDQVPTDNDNDAEGEYATMERSGSDKTEKTQVVSNVVDETKDVKESAESGISATLQHAQKESVTTENRKAGEIKEIIFSDATYESNDQDTEDSSGKISIVENSVTNSEQTEEERAAVQYPPAGVAEETKIASIPAFNSKDVDTEDIVTEKITTEEMHDAKKVEEACTSDCRDKGIEPSVENKIAANESPSTDNTHIPSPTSTNSHKSIEEETPQKVKNLEDEGLEDSSITREIEEVCLQNELEVSTQEFKKKKDLQDIPIEAYKDEGHTPDGVLRLEPQEIENKIKEADSSSDYKAYTDLTTPAEKTCILESVTSEEALQSGAVIHSQENVTDSEDTKIRENQVGIEENQFKKRMEANEITQSEVSTEEITGEKEVAKICELVSLCEEGTNKNQEDEHNTEECRGHDASNALGTTENKIQYEELFKETEKTTASQNIGTRDAAENKSVEDSHQASAEIMIAEESFSKEFDGKEVGDSAIKLDANTQGEKCSYGSGKAEAKTPEDEELSITMSREESFKGFATDSTIIQENRELEQSSCATSRKQIPTEADFIQHPYITAQTGNDYSPTLQQQGTTENPKKEKTNPEGKQQVHDSGEKPTEESALIDSTAASLSDLLQKSIIESTKVAKQVDEGREATNTGDSESKETEATHVQDAKMDEDLEGNEDKRTDSSSDDPVMIEASRDVADVKVAHKKSHNILSGVGSKVKHSISKVRKAITGKSSQPKPVSPK